MKIRINVKVKARARQARVERVGEGQYKVWVRETPEKGRANEAVLRAMSERLGVPKSRVELVSGRTSANKTLQVSG